MSFIAAPRPSQVNGGLAMSLSIAARIAVLAVVKRWSSRRSGKAASRSGSCPSVPQE